MMLTVDTNPFYFEQRREALFEKMPMYSALIVINPGEVRRNGDTDFRYRPNSDFYYLTGFREPESAAVFLKKEQGTAFLMFVPPNDPDKEVWTGKRAGVDGAKAQYGAGDAYTVDQFYAALPQLLLGCETVYYPIGESNELEHCLRAIIVDQRFSKRNANAFLKSFMNSDSLLHEMRLYKSPEECALMRKAATITAQAHIRGMRACRPGMKEYQLAAEIVYEFQRNGCVSEAYPSIVGGGHNGCVLHYHENHSVLNDGDLVLVDAGAEYEDYAADVTRTYPVNGVFSREQQAIYEIVLAAQAAAIVAAVPGKQWDDLQNPAIRTVVQGLLDLKLLQGDCDALIESKAYKHFYMHSIGHWLGMEVHDVGRYYQCTAPRLFAPGMVLTVEPGIYIAPNNLQVDERWRGIGIRIEDDILVTEQGPDILTIDAPKSVEAIQQLMKKS
jgi:Xaa-Pro aminopeptidase